MMIVTYFDLEPTMSTLLYVDFPYPGPWGEDMAIAMKELAQSISQEPGLIWKLWTENQEQSKAGGCICSVTRQAHRPIWTCTASGSTALVSPASTPAFLM